MLQYRRADGFGPPGAVDLEIERLDSLAKDLRLLRAGIDPDLAMFPDAPIIDHWMWLRVPRLAMCGFVTGHPHLEDGKSAATSDVWIDGRELGWVRTHSRYYRIGRHFGHGLKPDYVHQK